MEITKISWADSTFNPWIGCTKISDGCDHCYAEREDSRNLRSIETHWGKGAPRRITSDAYWRKPLVWERNAVRERRRRKVFCASMADWADAEAPSGARLALWNVIRLTPHLDWLLLTKRPGNIRRFLPEDWGSGYANVWLGVTAENRKQGLPRLEILKQMPASIRFVSFEPLLEDLGELNLTGIDWAIVGGETGPGARTMDTQWARSIVRQCNEQRLAVWVKQLGRNPVANGAGLRLLKSDGKRDFKGDDVDRWPRSLRTLSIRQHPKPLTSS